MTVAGLLDFASAWGSPRRRTLWAGAGLVVAALLFLVGWRLGRVESQPTVGMHSVLPGEFQPCQTAANGVTSSNQPSRYTCRWNISEGVRS